MPYSVSTNVCMCVCQHALRALRLFRPLRILTHFKSLRSVLACVGDLTVLAVCAYKCVYDRIVIRLMFLVVLADV